MGYYCYSKQASSEYTADYQQNSSTDISPVAGNNTWSLCWHNCHEQQLGTFHNVTYLLLAVH